jgi:spermidine/putrescine transport system permease protein
MDRAGRGPIALLTPAMLAFVGLFVAPLAWLLVVSFWSVRARRLRPDLTLDNYATTLVQYGDVLVTTLLVAGGVAVATTFLAFAFAYAIRFRLGRFGDAFLMVALITLFGGYLVKIYAWKSILGSDGVLNQAMIGLGLIEAPLQALLYSFGAVMVTLTYFLLPFAVLPIYGNLRSIREVTVEAAHDLGAGSWAVLRDVILPQCQTGLLTAFTLAFLISVGDYVTPRFVGGGAAMMGTFIEGQFSTGFNWPLGSAMAFTTMTATLLIVLVVRALLARMLRP